MHDDRLIGAIASPHGMLIGQAIGYAARRAAARAKIEHLQRDAPVIEGKMRAGDPAASDAWRANRTLLQAAQNELEIVERAERKARAELQSHGIAV
jgi:hypothetical protein